MAINPDHWLPLHAKKAGLTCLMQALTPSSVPSCPQYVLAKKGPLGKIWLAAHMEKKVPKLQIIQTNIPESVEIIQNPTLPMALRVSGHLLLGVVRVFSRKVTYLLTDCSDALVKIKDAFGKNAGGVELAAGAGVPHAAREGDHAAEHSLPRARLTEDKDAEGDDGKLVAV